MTKVVVTGGAGFIGSHLVDALVSRGDDVHVIDNYAGGKRADRMNAAATYHELDICNYDAIAPIIAGASIVFHEAALPRVQYSIEYPLETMQVNVMGSANVLRAAKEGGVKRFVCASSGAVYGDQDRVPFVETMTPNPKSPYALHKLMLEELALLWSRVYGLETVVLRYFNVYGSRVDPDGPYALAVGKFIKMRGEGKPITIWGDGEQTRDFTHVRDIVAANLAAGESQNVGKGEVINIGAGRGVSVNQLATLIGGPTVFEPARLEPRFHEANNAKARELLGWEPKVLLEVGIAELKTLAGLS